MPTYTFYDTVTQEEYEEFMSMSELDEYKKMNPQVNQVYVPIALVGDHVMGVGPKTDGGFEERMSQIANAHPGSPLASKYKSNESHAKIKARSIIDKHKKKRPFVS